MIGIVHYEVIKGSTKWGSTGRRPGEREMFERVAKLVKTDRMRPWRLDQLARSIFLTDFVSALFRDGLSHKPLVQVGALLKLVLA